RGRLKNRGLVYLRRSSGKRETSLETQLAWACNEARKHGVPLDATPADLQKMQAEKLHAFKDIRLDDSISGANLNRAGFKALLIDVKADATISHLYLYKRDRLGRFRSGRRSAVVLNTAFPARRIRQNILSHAGFSTLRTGAGRSCTASRREKGGSTNVE